MSPRYFQGQTVTGFVRASQAQTFREVVDTMRLCPTLGISREAFLKLDKKKRNEIKQVPFFVPAVFQHSPSQRVYAQALHCNLIFLDIDELPDGRCPAAPFVSNPDSLYSALGDFNFAAHTTASSTPEKPRMRVVVDADGISLDDYPRAVETIAGMLGLPRITSESRVAVQPMFLPTMFADSTDDDHPLIAFRLDGKTFFSSDLQGRLPDGKTFQENEKPHDGKISGDIDSLDFLRAPVPEITLKLAREALFAIDPDIGYLEWLECAAALKHQFSPKLAEEAFNLFDEWSEGGSKYGGEEETRAKWDSLRQTPIGRAPVTIRSLLRQAAAAGWDDKRVRETCFNEAVEWLETAPTVTELIEKGAKKILAVPLLTAVQEDVLVNQLCAQARKRFAYTITPSAIRKDLGRLKVEISNQGRSAEKQREPSWAKGVCYVAAMRHFFRQRTGEKYKPETFNDTYARWLLPTATMLKEAGIPVTPAALSKPIVPPADYALNHLRIPTVYDYAYDPAQPNELFFVDRGRKYVNCYSPTYPELDPKHQAEAGRVFVQHLKHLVAEKEYRRILISFMAYMVQFPGRKIRWATLLQSVEGAGKTYLSEVMKAVLGSEHVRTISGEAIHKGWNEWSFGSQLIVLEEVRVAGTNRHEIMNALKPLITNDDISINQRNRDTRQANNCANYMLFSNHHDALALTPGDRRYFVIKSPLQAKRDVLALGESYFDTLYGMLHDFPGALRAWLNDWQIPDDFQPDGHAPRTSYVMEMVSDGATDIAAAVRRLLIEGDYPLIQYDIVSSKTLHDVLTLEENVLRAGPQQLARVLREEGFRQAGRHLFGTERHYLWARPGISDQLAHDIAAERMEKGLKNLGMELLYD